MKDGYRYFVTYSTGEDGLPVTSNDPSYFRFPGDVLDGRLLVPYWCINSWNHSLIQPLHAYLDDVLGSGATVRELLSENEVPHA
jgi:hypothetical protein